MTDYKFLRLSELETLELLATGVSNSEIADQIEICVNTVKVHPQNIFKKFIVNIRTEDALLAIQKGYINE